jgi:hypothetical protein
MILLDSRMGLLIAWVSVALSSCLHKKWRSNNAGIDTIIEDKSVHIFDSTRTPGVMQVHGKSEELQEVRIHSSGFSGSGKKSEEENDA